MTDSKQTNLVGGIIDEISKELKIWQDTSSAYHLAGNKCIENAVGRIKTAIGDRKIADAMSDINALNMSQPYNSKTYTACEELYGLVFPVNGIPMPEHLKKELVSREFLADKIQKAELCGSNPKTTPFNSEDTTHKQGRKTTYQRTG